MFRKILALLIVIFVGVLGLLLNFMFYISIGLVCLGLTAVYKNGNLDVA